ncbi:hypothetical protein J1614_011703 [Plenodomus biglobosus]|nr:hypothetical protein J1614_011703 [Plenodomus biglobosus]
MALQAPSHRCLESFLRQFLVSTYPQFVAHGTVELHLMVPDRNTYSTRQLYAFLQDVRCFTENVLLSLHVFVSTKGKGIGRSVKELRKIASAVEWVKDTSQVEGSGV